MRHLSTVAAFLGAASAVSPLVHRASDVFSVAVPGGVEDVVITKENTINGTYHDSKTTVVHQNKLRDAGTGATSRPLLLELVNNHGGGQAYVYITGLDWANRVVFVKADGTLVYPSSGGSRVPVPVGESVAVPLPPGRGRSLRMALPIAISSGRVWIAEGQLHFYMVRTASGDGLVQPSPTNLRDPSSGINWGFAELTCTRERKIYANISYVDFVGLILSISLRGGNGRGSQMTRGLGANSVSKICQGMATQSSRDGFPWRGMCVISKAGNPIRVLSPNNYAIINPAGFQHYWGPYVDRVWGEYGRTPLFINTQSPAGTVACKVSGGLLRCGGGDNRGYAKPTANDIWGCNSGPFEKHAGDNAVHVAVIPRLCAAFVRSTLLLGGGNVQPRVASSLYYKTTPTSHYSRLVHELEVDGKGYAFPYDDVNPDGDGNASGVVASDDPEALTIYVGAPPP